MEGPIVKKVTGRDVSRFVMGVAFAAIVGYGVFVWHDVRRWEPPSEDCSFRAFLAKQASIEEMHVVRFKGREYLEILAPRRSAWLVSGPPSYVFDRHGTLIAWTLDRWDNRPYPGNEPETRVSQLNSVDEVLAWFDEDAPDSEAAGEASPESGGS